jgi:hypothetical protein
MDNSNAFCVYNLDRGVSLNSKVSLADCANQPLKILRIIVSGIALDAESGLWLKPLYGPPAVPRIFPFDLLYLDKDQRVLEAVEVFPEVELPVCPLEAESALLVPQKVLLATGTVRGDRLVVCPAQELDQELARIGGRSESSALRMAGAGAVTTREAVLSRPATLQETARVLSAPVLGNGHAKASPVVDSNRPENGSKGSDSQKQSKPEERREPSPAAIDAADAAKTPAIAITEVVIEKPPGTSPLRTPVHHDPGDLFANWVDSPAARPAWISHSPAEPLTQKPETAASAASASEADVIRTQERLTDTRIVGPGKASAEKVGAPETRVIPESTLPGQRKQADASPESQPLTAKQPSQARPAQPTIGLRAGSVPNPPSTSTFTIGQFGMWSVSPPTAVPSKGVAAGKAGNGVTPKDPPPPVQSKPVDASRATVAKPQDAPRTSVPSPPLSVRAASATSEARNPQPLGSQKPVASKDGLSGAAPAVQRKTNAPAGDSAASNATILKPALNQASGEPAIPNAATKRNESQKSGNASTLHNPQNRQAQSPPVAAQNGKKWGGAKPIETPASAANQNQTREVAEKPQSEASIAVPLVQPDRKNKPTTPSQPVGTNGKKEDDSHSLRARLKRWLHPVTPPSDRRRAYRRYVPGVVAHYYTGGAPKPFDVADISMSGLYLLTEDRWMPGTMIQMTLQKPCAKGERKQSITVLSRIVRKGSDGVGAEFVMPESIDSRSHDVQPTQTTDRFALARFL